MPLAIMVRVVDQATRLGGKDEGWCILLVLIRQGFRGVPGLNAWLERFGERLSEASVETRRVGV